MKKWLLVIGLLLTLVLLAGAPVWAAEKATHKVAIHVDQSDPKVMNMVLNNVKNLQKYYHSIGETVTIEVVANGPGLHMFRADTSPVKTRIEAMFLEIDELKLSACLNTIKAMSAGQDIELIDDVDIVPSGVAQLVHLQERGYAYLRP